MSILKTAWQTHFDVVDQPDVKCVNNKYDDYEKWREGFIPKRHKTAVKDVYQLIEHLYWVVPKTVGKVGYRVREDNKKTFTTPPPQKQNPPMNNNRHFVQPL